MHAMGGNDPQELINDELLNVSDVLVAIFKSSAGKTHGAMREVRFFVNKARLNRVMLFFHRDESLQEDSLRAFAQEMKKRMFCEPFADAKELTGRLGSALDDRVQRSLAIPHVDKLRAALRTRIHEWQSLDHGMQLAERGFTVIGLIAAALTSFQRRDVGRPLGAIDGFVGELVRRLRPSARDLDEFLTSSREHLDGVVNDLIGLVNKLPEEEELI